nr:hypothetical protein [Bradyrhizobium diazoefficiens]
MIADEPGQFGRVRGRHEMARTRNRMQRCVCHRAAQDIRACVQGPCRSFAAYNSGRKQDVAERRDRGIEAGARVEDMVRRGGGDLIPLARRQCVEPPRAVEIVNNAPCCRVIAGFGRANIGRVHVDEL